MKNRNPLRAAWDWYAPRSTEAERRRLIDLVSEVGFDTLVIHRPEADLVEYAHRFDIRVIGVVSPAIEDSLAAAKPDLLQRMTTTEEECAALIRQSPTTEQDNRLAHLWFPRYQGGNLLCYEHEESRSILVERVGRLLEDADGVALDGFGFRNHYGCFCETCSRSHGGQVEKIAEVSRRSLIDFSTSLYDRTKSEHPDAILMNHVWPPFNPDPYYGADLRLDYCSQTISWFYRPAWSLERVRLEAAEHSTRERPERNQFVPFIGHYFDPYQRRSAKRIEAELEIAKQSGNGSFVFCTLESIVEDEAIRNLLKKACLDP